MGVGLGRQTARKRKDDVVEWGEGLPGLLDRVGRESSRTPSYQEEEEKGKTNRGGGGRSQDPAGPSNGRKRSLPQPTLPSLSSRRVSHLLEIPPPLPLRAPSEETKGGSIQQTYTVGSNNSSSLCLVLCGGGWGAGGGYRQVFDVGLLPRAVHGPAGAKQPNKNCQDLQAERRRRGAETG